MSPKQYPTSKPIYLLQMFVACFILILVLLPRLTHLGGYVIIDEADRWRWAESFVLALNEGDAAATLVGDGYPGIVPIWAETIWIYGEAARRSLQQGEWIGEPGLYALMHEWERVENIQWQRLPIVLVNSLLGLMVIGMSWWLFGWQIGMMVGLLVAFDPFYLSDSRVNRAEALLTGLMTMSVLSLIAFGQHQQRRYIMLSGLFGGLSLLTKIQALAMLPAIGLILLWLEIGFWVDDFLQNNEKYSLEPPFAPIFISIKSFLIWLSVAGLTWFILWPAMWVTPLETIQLVYNYTTHKVGAEGINLFFWGQTYRDADPGLLFYPYVFLMRITPVALLGLVGFVWGTRHRVRLNANKRLVAGGTYYYAPVLLIYIVTYLLAMTIGSHKQDRYIMPIFLSVDILAAIGLFYIGYRLPIRSRPVIHLTFFSGFVTLLLVTQLLTIYPHHPYYYSYFNPLFGGGATATQTLRIGWGEGMDQVGAYLADKPDSRNLRVASRWTHNMVGFKGELISLLANGRWTQADYIVLYIHQRQRYQEPSVGFLDYFAARQPEHTITIGGIDYAHIYPIPFDVPADPQQSRIPERVTLLGYRWEQADSVPVLQIVGENLGDSIEAQLQAQLSHEDHHTDWVSCSAEANHDTTLRGRYVEWSCPFPTITELPADVYNIQFGLADGHSVTGSQSIPFSRGRLAVQINQNGQVSNTPEIERLDTLTRQTLPESTRLLERVYQKRLQLVGYQLEPSQPHPGHEVRLTLHWQKSDELLEPLQLTVQLADSRSLNLGRDDQPLDVPTWQLGQIMTSQHHFELDSALDVPLAGQIEVMLANPAQVMIPATNRDGKPLDMAIGRFTVQLPDMPKPDMVAHNLSWQDNINLTGYKTSAASVKAGDTVTINLFWQASQTVEGNYMAFIHLLDEAGQIVAQNDGLPRAGAYPTPWWQVGLLVSDLRHLTIPADTPAGQYQLQVGLYEPESWARLPLGTGADSAELTKLEVKE
ncbi:glycosyltransferase family 39 protein [Anaerolineales bacterium HSG24]|nr:glycosyltransferase family 39 protein [Anaerolineales bacterium HSG24]